MIKIILTTALLVLLSLQSLIAQTGREFWFVAPEVTASHGDAPLLFRFTATNEKANVRISMPANNNFTPISITIDPNTQVFHEIDKNTIENRPSDQINNKGIHITSDVDITVYYEVANSVNPEKFSLKGDKALGKEFFVPSQNLYRNYPYRPIACEKADIVATENHTRITIVPTVDITGHSANVPYTLILDQGQTYSIEYKDPDYKQSMAGTQIYADKPIAVTISDDSVNEPGVGPQDLIGDQLIPISALGTDYIAVKAYGRSEPCYDQWGRKVYVSPVNKLFILAIEDGTILVVDNDPSRIVVLDKGDLIDLDIVNSALYIHSNKPVYAYQLAGIPNGNGNEMGSAIVPPIDKCSGSRKVSFTRTFNQRFYIQLVTQGRNRESFILKDDNNMVLNHLDGISWELVSGTDQDDPDIAWYSVSMPLDISTGVPHSIENTTGLFHMSILDENAGSASFAYLSSIGNGPIIDGLTKACTGNAIVLQTNEPHTNYKWYSEFSDPQVLSTDASISVTESGTYWVTTQMESGGCEQTDTVVVEFTGPEFDLGPDQMVCPGEEVKLALPAGLGTYTWYDGSTDNTNTVVVGPGDNMDVWVEVTDNSELACRNRDQVHLEAYDTPALTIPSEYAVVCVGEAIHCNNEYDRYQWYIDNAEQSGETESSIIATKSGTYTVEGWNDEGCRSTQSIDVMVHALPEIAINDVINCYGQPQTFSAPFGMDTYEWTNGTNILSHQKDLTLDQPDNIQLKVVDGNGCKGVADFNFSWHANILFEVSSTFTEVCENNSFSIECTAGLENYYWELVRSDGTWSVLPATTPGNVYIDECASLTDDAGMYIVTARDNFGCVVTNSIDVNINPLPVFDLGPDIITNDPKVTLSGPSGYTLYDWSNGSTTPIIVVNSSGDYSLTVTDELGCKGMDEINVTFDQATYIPETNQAPITLYPNPSQGTVYIDRKPGITIQNIQVFNSKGELTPVQLTMKADQATLTGLQPGLHFVIVQTEAGHFQSKVIVK